MQSGDSANAGVGFAERFIEIDGGQLQVGCWTPPSPVGARSTVVILHDGLGAYSLWGDIPARIAGRSQCSVVAVNRPGHGHSTPIPRRSWPTDWLHREADRLAILLSAGRLPVGEKVHLVGHSDGGSIALLAALAAPERIERVTTLAAHTWVEHVCTAAIAALRADPDRLLASLARAHRAPRAVFDAWSQVWLSDEFATWDIRRQLSALHMPVTIVQGAADEYATEDMLRLSASAIGDNAQALLMADWPHLMNRTHPISLADLIVALHR